MQVLVTMVAEAFPSTENGQMGEAMAMRPVLIPDTKKVKSDISWGG